MLVFWPIFCVRILFVFDLWAIFGSMHSQKFMYFIGVELVSGANLFQSLHMYNTVQMFRINKVTFTTFTTWKILFNKD